MEENSKKMKSGLEKAPHRSLLYALGLTREEMERPLVGVVNAASEVVPGHLHLGKLAEAVKAGVRMAGGTPLEFPAIAVCDGIAMNHEGMRFSLPSREFIADSIEIMARAHAFDALVFIPNCDKCVPGMLMAMMRLNIPSVLVSGGPMLPGTLTPGKQGDLITLFEGVGRVRNGQMSEEELTQWEERACPGCGSCAGMFTANSMNCLAETIGVALPGNGTIPAVHAARVRLAKQAGMRVMDLVKRNIRPCDIVTRGAVENAIAVDMALGCSTNTTLHLPAIFHEAGLDIDLSVFDEVSRKSPNLCKLSPAGHHYMVDLENAGGIPAVMSELDKLDLIRKDCMTVTGKTVGENLKDRNAHILDTDVIHTIDNAYSKEGGIAILRGSLAPDGAVVKQSAVAPECSRAKKTPCTPSSTARSSPATAWWCVTKVPRAAPACARCCPPPPPSPAWAWARTWPCSPTAVSPAVPTVRPSATSRPKPPTVAPSPWCVTATASWWTSPTASWTCWWTKPNWPAVAPSWCRRRRNAPIPCCAVTPAW